MLLPEISLDLQITRQRKTYGCLNAQEGQKKCIKAFCTLTPCIRDQHHTGQTPCIHILSLNICKSDPKPIPDEELLQLKNLCVCCSCTSATCNNFKMKG